MDEVDHSRWDPRLEEQADEQLRRPGDPFGRFEDERVPAGDRQRGHPERDHRGEVERGDARHDPDRLVAHRGVDVARDVGKVSSLEQGGRAGRELGRLQAPADGPPRLLERLAVLLGDPRCQDLEVRLQEATEPPEEAGPVGGGRRAPSGPRGPRRGHGVADLAGAGERDPAEDPAVRRIRDGEGRKVLRSRPRGADQVPEHGRLGVHDGATDASFLTLRSGSRPRRGAGRRGIIYPPPVPPPTAGPRDARHRGFHGSQALPCVAGVRAQDAEVGPGLGARKVGTPARRPQQLPVPRPVPVLRPAAGPASTCGTPMGTTTSTSTWGSGASRAATPTRRSSRRSSGSSRRGPCTATSGTAPPRSPSGSAGRFGMDQVRFSSTGLEATHHAIRIARAVTGHRHRDQVRGIATTAPTTRSSSA